MISLDDVIAAREWLRRAWCGLLGHTWRWSSQGEPVASFWVCTRCGRWVR